MANKKKKMTKTLKKNMIKWMIVTIAALVLIAVVAAVYAVPTIMG